MDQPTEITTSPTSARLWSPRRQRGQMANPTRSNCSILLLVSAIYALSVSVSGFVPRNILLTYPQREATSASGHAVPTFLDIRTELAYMSRSARASSSSSSNDKYNVGRSTKKQSRGQLPPKPFLIERIGDVSSENIYRQISDMCIDVFFKEQLNAQPRDRIPPWKEAQISYLKTLQAGDLRRRRDRYPRSNEMFLAYTVEPALDDRYFRNQPIIMDNGEIYNLPNYVADQPFVRGEIIGFVEITQRPYGLGTDDNRGSYVGQEVVRPVLTNLAVSRKARTLGIGSKLLDRCERHVARNWKMNEIVLEVEDYNDNAANFYQKRGYSLLFSDPASRRFDVQGLVLRKVRCTRQVFRKVLALQRAQRASEDIDANFFNPFAQFIPRGRY